MTDSLVPPVVRWSGSKRPVAATLARLFPRADRFLDPFVGGGAILPYRSGTPAIVGDIVYELVELWRLIQRNPDAVIHEYRERWTRLQDEGHLAFYEIRDRFNADRDPCDLLFLSRTCVNGLIRFNRRGDFNNSLHHTRPGISPDRLAKIVYDWSHWVQDVQFVASDYRETLEGVQSGDVVFLDPPYASNRGRYRKEAFTVEPFFEELARLNALGARWLLTFDGQAGDRSYEDGLPEDLYRHRYAMATGNSPFPRLMNSRLDAISESVFVNFDPPAEALCQLSQSGQQRGSVRANEQLQTTLPFA